MNKFERYSKFLPWFTAFMLSMLLAGCGGGSEGQSPILGMGSSTVLPATPPVVPPTTPPATPPVNPAPTITAVAPINAATVVPINTTITAAFSEPMSPITGAASFTVTCTAPCANPAGTVTLDATNEIASFTLHSATALTPQTLYTATVTGAKSVATGLALASPFAWQFTTGVTPDTTRPSVTLTVPATTTSGPTAGVPTNTAITALFTEGMAPATITSASFVVTCSAPCTSPAGKVSYSVGNRTAVFTPTAALTPGVTYTATITTAATDLAGNALAGNQGALPAASNYSWAFVTAVAIPAANIALLSTNPAANAVGVCPGAAINATFNAPSGLRINPTTINTTSFTVTGPAPALTPVIGGSVVLDAATGSIATFTPLSALTAGVTYTATIEGGANGIKDLAVPANVMSRNFTWSFTAGSCAAPVTPAAISLGSASTFGIFGGAAGMTSSGTLTVVNGNIGTTAVSTAVTGFHDAGTGCIYTQTPLNAGIVNGLIYTAPPSPTVACPGEGTATTFSVASQARADTLAAYNTLVAQPGGPDPGAGNLANLTLAPGDYTAASGSFMIQGGNLTLDAQGNANAVWIFQMATTLTVGGPGAAAPQSIILTNGAQAKNVFWQVGSAATINAGGGGTVVGTIIAQAGATFSTSGNVALVTLNGRALSLGAAVTLVNTVINIPAP